MAITGSTIFIFTYMDSQWQIQKIVLCGGGVWQLCVPEDHQCPLMERWRGLLYIVQNLGGGGGGGQGHCSPLRFATGFYIIQYKGQSDYKQRFLILHVIGN